VYNYLELREELRAKDTGCFHTDTEVILAAYSEWEWMCVPLQWDVGVRLYDRRLRRIFCSRDVGVSRLLCSTTGVRLRSEIKQLLPFLPLGVHAATCC